MSNHPITPLAAAQVNHDHLKIELVEPLGLPPFVRIIWPAAATVVDPKRFPDVAAAIASCLLGRTSCSLQSGRSGDSNRAGRQRIFPGLAPPSPDVGPPPRR